MQDLVQAGSLFAVLPVGLLTGTLHRLQHVWASAAGATVVALLVAVALGAAASHTRKDGTDFRSAQASTKASPPRVVTFEG